MEHEPSNLNNSFPKLTRTDAPFWGIFNYAPFGQVFSDQDGNIIAANNHFSAMLGYTPSDLVGKPLLSLISPVDYESIDGGSEQLRYGQIDRNVALRRFLRSDGTVVHTQACTFILKEREELYGWVSIVHDLSELDDARTNQIRAQDSAKDTVLQLDLLYTLATKAISSSKLSEFAPFLLKEVCTRLKWLSGALLEWPDTDSHPEPQNNSTRVRATFGKTDWLSVPALQQPVQGHTLYVSENGQNLIIVPITAQYGTPAAFAFMPGQPLHELSSLPRQFLSVMAETCAHVADRAATATRLFESQLRYQALFDDSRLPKALLHQASDIITAANNAFCDLLGLTPSEVVGKPLSTFTHPDDLHLVARGRHIAAETRHEYSYERRYIHASGHTIETNTTVSWITSSDGVVMLLVQLNDLTPSRTLERHLQRQVNIDELTGLATRLALRRTLEGLRNTDAYSLLFIDLDGLGAINNRHGHHVGDEILTEIGHRLLRVTTKADLVARAGGDEFAIVYHTPKSHRTSTISLAQHIQNILKTPVKTSDGAVNVSASIGICDGSLPSFSGLERLRNADAAAYYSKRQGGNRITIYDARLRQANNRTWETEELLRESLEHDSLTLHYQPIVSLLTNEVVAVEALTRLRAADGTLVSPLMFIPVAEASGMIIPMGKQVLTKACHFIAGLNAAVTEPLRLAVNLAAHEAAQVDLAKNVIRTLDATGLPPSRLTLELTESTLLDAGAAVTAQLFELRSMGVNIALDDFGTGYSSLTYLQRLPITIIKIDQSFVAQITTNQSSAAIITAVANLAQDLGLQWVAEGIETEEQATMLRELGSGYGQGYLFSKPLPEPGLIKFLANQG